MTHDRAFRLRVTALHTSEIILPASSTAVAKRKAIQMLKEAFAQEVINAPDDFEIRAEVLREGP